MATYPGGVYSPRAIENKSGVVYDADKKTVLFADDINNTNNEIVAIETALGINPVFTPLRPTTEKTSLVDADEVTGNNSANAFSQIRTTWTNVKAFLKTYFDTLYATAANTLTFTNKRITPRVGTVDDSATPTPTGDDQDIFTITALAQNATIGTPGGTPVNGQKLIIRILDAGAAKTLAWNAIYRAGTDVALPTTTVLSKTLYCGFIYNSAATKWDLVAVTNNI